MSVLFVWGEDTARDNHHDHHALCLTVYVVTASPCRGLYVSHVSVNKLVSSYIFMFSNIKSIYKFVAFVCFEKMVSTLCQRVCVCGTCVCMHENSML